MPTITQSALTTMLYDFRLHLQSDKRDHEYGWLIMGCSEHIQTVIGPGPKAVSSSSHIEFDKSWQIDQAEGLPRVLQTIGTVHSHPLTFRQMSSFDLHGLDGKSGHAAWVDKFGPGIFGLIFEDLSFQWYVLEPGKDYQRVEMEVIG